MKTSHVLDELSAYIDGEGRNAEGIARHLQSCPACARRHMELLKVSANVKALRGPESNPAFVTRLMARIGDEQPRRSRAWYVALQVAFAACLLAMVSVGIWRWLPEGEPLETGVLPETHPRLNVTWQDDERVVEEFSRLMDEGVNLDLFGDPGEPVSEDAQASEPPPALLAGLGAPDVSAALVDLLGTLSEDELRVLDQMLEDYESEV